MFTSALICLEVFAVVAMIDGVYFHLLKYRLFAHRGSRYEHVLHTIHAFFFPFLVFLLFLADLAGAALWAAVALVAADFVVELLDVGCERESRAALGGLSSPEYTVHVLAITSRVSAFTLALAARPAAAWSLRSSSMRSAALATLPAAICWVIAAGGVAMAALHVILLRSPQEQHSSGENTMLL